MNTGPYPLRVDDRPHGGAYVIATNQNNHYATTHDPYAASMILAGPEMLSALRLCVERLEFHTKHGQVTVADTDAWMTANQAIQKATQP